MKLVIEHSTTKREIVGIFNLCGSRKDLMNLAAQINNRLDDDSWSYGWMTVYPETTILANTEPKPWDA
jgi:hypothetical protein